jgi:uncharacterized SAM-binding protein YcdF (DUF218 family)
MPAQSLRLRGWCAAPAHTAASLLALLLATPWLPAVCNSLGDHFSAVLENRFPRVEAREAAAVAGVIALGGGEERIREAARLARHHRHMLVLVSGAGTPEHVLEVLGGDIEPERVVVEAHSSNTYENAVFSAAVLPERGRRWLLVTSAAHMPRAIGAFRKQRIAVIPWPIRDPSGSEADRISGVRHEIVGLAAYWLLGRTSALFPAPDATDIAAAGSPRGRAQRPTLQPAWAANLSKNSGS